MQRLPELVLSHLRKNTRTGIIRSGRAMTRGLSLSLLVASLYYSFFTPLLFGGVVDKKEVIPYYLI